ncbi:MAG: hypothetical protein PHC95_11685 [Parabacteroides sp.]|nr:hypothetical protein [Parabacteroides sp.]
MDEQFAAVCGRECGSPNTPNTSIATRRIRLRGGCSRRCPASPPRGAVGRGGAGLAEERQRGSDGRQRHLRLPHEEGEEG